MDLEEFESKVNSYIDLSEEEKLDYDYDTFDESFFKLIDESDFDKEEFFDSFLVTDEVLNNKSLLINLSEHSSWFWQDNIHLLDHTNISIEMIIKTLEQIERGDFLYDVQGDVISAFSKSSIPKDIGAIKKALIFFKENDQNKTALDLFDKCSLDILKDKNIRQEFLDCMIASLEHINQFEFACWGGNGLYNHWTKGKQFNFIEKIRHNSFVDDVQIQEKINALLELMRINLKQNKKHGSAFVECFSNDKDRNGDKLMIEGDDAVDAWLNIINYGES